MVPTFFGQPELFGIHHRAESGAQDGNPSVLLCPPIGHEHTRSVRALRLLADALARAGHHVLRFDFRGLGDSSGQPADGDPVAWGTDLFQALHELWRFSGSRPSTVVGLRVGASLAVHALSTGGGADFERCRIVLWDPVIRGTEFLDNATDLDGQFFADPGRFPDRTKSLAVPTPGGDRSTLLGYSYSDSLRAWLESFDLSRVSPWPFIQTEIVASRPSSEFESLVARIQASGHQARCTVVAGTDGAWEDYSQHELALRAGRIVPVIVQRLTEGGGV